MYKCGKMDTECHSYYVKCFYAHNLNILVSSPQKPSSKQIFAYAEAKIEAPPPNLSPNRRFTYTAVEGPYQRQYYNDPVFHYDYYVNQMIPNPTCTH